METIQASAIRNQLFVRKEKLQTVVKQAAEPSKFVNLLQQVDSALEKLDQGTYGICELCHDSIEEDRIFIDPLVTVCLGCLDEAQQNALERDLEFAAKIQRNLLPKNNISVNGWDFSYHYNPAGPVSGDFTDIIPLNDGSVIFIIGDVSGKGISASLMMSHLHALIHTLVSFELPINEIIGKANRLFCESMIYSNYATMVMGKVNIDGTLEICVAGHNPPLLVKDGLIHSINATGVPVGLFCEAEYSVKKFSLENGDSLLLYTDGLTESTVNGIEYGEDRLKAHLLKTNCLSSKPFIDELMNEHKIYLNNTSPADDLTVLVIKKVNLDSFATA